jgi:capsular polysaccharide biosynthesis protein
MNWVDFSPLVLNLFRDRVLDSLNVIPDGSVPKRITFERRSATRNVLSRGKLEKVFDDFSFEKLHLNSNFFDRQVKVFFNTKFVATPGGAVLANVIFMKPGSKVLVLKSWGNRKLNLWAKLCESLNLECIEISGLPTYWGLSFLRRLHSNFYISPKKLRRVLSREI